MPASMQRSARRKKPLVTDSKVFTFAQLFIVVGLLSLDFTKGFDGIGENLKDLRTDRKETTIIKNTKKHLQGELDSGCNPEDEHLSDHVAWQREEGYWIGEYSFYQSDGNAFESSSWNYPYDHYTGFVHIELNGNALKQRNVFLYPPQIVEKCATLDLVIGEGTCGVNGNEKVF